MIVAGCPQLTREGQWMLRDHAIRGRHLSFDRNNIAATYLKRDTEQSEEELPRTFHLRMAEEEPESKTIVLRWQDGPESESRIILLCRAKPWQKNRERLESQVIFTGEEEMDTDAAE